MARWAIFGASGFVGSHLADSLERGGHSVLRIKSPRVTMHPTESVSDVKHSVDSLISLYGSIVMLLEGADVVVNAAGVAQPGRSADSILYGANSALPLLLARLSARASVNRFVHISSAAVQGRMNPLTSDRRQEPFSPYSRSKALAERALFEESSDLESLGTELVQVRATSVQGDQRRTTRALRNFAGSPFSSVAGGGTQASPVSTIEGLARVIENAGLLANAPGLILQPWEGLSAAGVLRLLGAKEPLHLPVGLCRSIVAATFLFGRCGIPGAVSLARRIELLWFGQDIEDGQARVQI